MLNQGKSQKKIAIHFGVSPAAICKRVKRLLGKKPESFKNLTKKEQNFAIAIAGGENQTKAAVNSFNVSSMDSAKAIGCQLMKKPSVTMAIKDLMDFHGLDKSYRIAKLKEHVDNFDPNVSLKSLDLSFKLDGSYTEKHIHVHSYKEIKQEQAECHDRISHLDRKFKNDYMTEIKKLHPEMDDETVSEMAEKTLNALFPERENLNYLGSDTIEAEVIEDD
jgi:phage terminase small subunit